MIAQLGANLYGDEGTAPETAIIDTNAVGGGVSAACLSGPVPIDGANLSAVLAGQIKPGLQWFWLASLGAFMGQFKSAIRVAVAHSGEGVSDEAQSLPAL